MTRSFLFLCIAILLLDSGSLFAQSAGMPVEEIVRRAGVRRKEYLQAFKDLNAQETQHLEEYGDDDKVKRRREVVSDLIIYQSQVDPASMVEYRNVRIVDGKPVSESDHRAEQLFARLAKASSLKNELDRIDRESRRYDFKVGSFYGYTLNQGFALDEAVSRSFKFTVAGAEQIDGHDCITVSYEQIALIPGYNTKLSLPKQLAGAEPMYRGRLWLDRGTFRLRREEQEFGLRHPSSPSLLPFIRSEFNYSESRFDILTPTRIVMSTFTRGRNRPDGTPETLIGGKMTFEYGPFSRFEVTQDYKAN